MVAGCASSTPWSSAPSFGPYRTVPRPASKVSQMSVAPVFETFCRWGQIRKPSEATFSTAPAGDREIVYIVVGDSRRWEMLGDNRVALVHRVEVSVEPLR